MIKSIIHRLTSTLQLAKCGYQAVSHAQCGEDIILEDACELLGLRAPTYLDIGANHPVKLNNTYKFYRKGCWGVLIEPNEALIHRLRRSRPKDRVLNCGVGEKAVAEADFFVLSDPALSSFSEHEAEIAVKAAGVKFIRKTSISIRTIEEIILNEFGGLMPNIISIDVEGMDEELIRSTDWSVIRPDLICVETRDFTNDAKTANRNQAIGEHLRYFNYGVFGLTYCNTIFVDLTKFPCA